MFEDALMESGGGIRTQRSWTSTVAAICNGSIACLFVLLPLLHPASLPRQTFHAACSPSTACSAVASYASRGERYARCDFCKPINATSDHS